MTCWIILGTAPTADECAIKHAYGPKLNIPRQGEDAAAHQALREAFDKAVLLTPRQGDGDSASRDNDDDFRIGADRLPERRDAAMLLVQIKQIYHRGGGAALLAQWPHIRAEPDRVALEKTDQTSRQLLCFAREQHIDSGGGQVGWAWYFDGHEDYRSAVCFRRDRWEELRNRMQAAPLLSSEDQASPYGRRHMGRLPDSNHAAADNGKTISKTLAAFLETAKPSMWPHWPPEQSKDNLCALRRATPSTQNQRTS